jgi:hypothetical protein
MRLDEVAFKEGMDAGPIQLIGDAVITRRRHGAQQEQRSCHDSESLNHDHGLLAEAN